jgi:hypothetical protein
MTDLNGNAQRGSLAYFATDRALRKFKVGINEEGALLLWLRIITRN